MSFIPSGAPGLDGLEADFLNGLSGDALQALSDLLNLVDRSRVPEEWRYARVTLIPKPGETDRRPLTILSCAYRLWARRHAARLQDWLLEVKPAGLSGAVAGTGCADVLWTLQSLLHEAVAGESDPAFVLSMDLSKCFDRMCLPPLQDICRAIGFSEGLVSGHLAVCFFGAGPLC